MGGKNEFLNTEQDMHPVAVKPKGKKKKSSKWKDAQRGEPIRGFRCLRQGKEHGGRGSLRSI